MIKKYGNKTGIDPKDDIVPYYLNYPMTQFDNISADSENKNVIPQVNDTNVKEAKDFVDSNHK